MSIIDLKLYILCNGTVKTVFTCSQLNAGP